MCAKPKKNTSKRQQTGSKRSASKRDGSASSASASAAEDSAIGTKITEADTDRDTQQFIRGLVIRGEAVESEAAESGAVTSGDDELPPGATHKIVKNDEQGLPIKVQRERFSAY